MDIYVDTANLDEIKIAASLGVLDGVTTNPSLIAKEGVPFKQRMKEICAVVKGPVSAEVVSVEHDAMIAEAEPLIDIAENIVIKFPCIEEGIKACKTLSDRGVRVNMTLCFQPLQALLAAKAGAFLISPFVGHPDPYWTEWCPGRGCRPCPRDRPRRGLHLRPSSRSGPP